jgi:hypothetical protein
VAGGDTDIEGILGLVALSEIALSELGVEYIPPLITLTTLINL